MIPGSLDAARVAEWRERYSHAHRSFVACFISRIEAIDALRNLRFRDDALKVEILEWERDKVKARIAETAKRAAEKADAQREKRRAERYTTPSSSL